ncbi:MAG: amidohydrolase [Xanthobacteraceae bacterium]|jgi:5-methylthioadenosine/S-adenosylhomocysteine deaminase|nr:amidohydrolase [Xanthobacteraceae bacterium]
MTRNVKIFRHPSRRAVLTGGASVGLLSALGTGLRAQGAATRPSSQLPQRGNFLIKGAYIITMDAQSGDLSDGDLHINNGAIVAVGRNLTVPPGAEILSGKDMIVLPGFVDTHTHLWSTQMRGRFGDTAETIYFRTRNILAPGYQPEDSYQGTRLGAAEAIHSGITTAVDFFHNNRGMDHVNACIDALKETGLRCRFHFGPATTTTPTQSMDLAGLEQLHQGWATTIGDRPLSLGLAWRGPLGITTPTPGEPVSPGYSVAKTEFETARRLGLPIVVHVSGVTARQQFDALVKGNFLGKDVQLAHFSNASAAEIKIAAEAGSPLTLTPLTELRVGYGVTQLGDYLAGGMKVGLGVDSNSLAGVADMFTVMKTFQGIEAGRLKNELAITPRKLLELATIEGARSIGMDDRIGSIAAGKRADVIMVNTQALNMGMFADDPAHLLVEAARPSNVDSVWVDGRLLKRGGRMTALDEAAVVSGAKASITEIVSRTRR